MGGGGGGWALITVDDGGEGGKNCQNIDYVICERPLSTNILYIVDCYSRLLH